MGNVFADIPAALPKELVETLLTADNLRIERIISLGHASAPDFWYDQAQPEWVLLLQGAARLEFEDRMIVLKAGDYLHIPAHQRHRVASTDSVHETIWLAIHYGYNVVH